MFNAFEDIKREYVNHFSDSHGRLFAQSYDEFVEKLLCCIQETLNTTYTDDGHHILRDALVRAKQEDWSPEKWQQFKVDALKLLFFVVLDECQPLKHEFALHLYDELRKSPSDCAPSAQVLS